MNSFLAALAATIVTMAAPGPDAGGITATHGTVVQTEKAGQQTQGFFQIHNSGAADTLTGVSCAIADTTLLAGADGKPVASLAVPAGQNMNLTANGPHLVLQSTHFPVQFGGILPCSLTFANAGTISIFLYATPAPEPQ